MSQSKFAKLLATAFLATGLTVVPTWVALAVTNPADNPSPITVQGDDGNTYQDGADTLPGYDDEECTYIPGAYFDFAANRVRYADGQSIHWTEWERASGYNEWLAKQNSQPTPTPATSPEDQSSSSQDAGTKKETTAKNGSTIAKGSGEAIESTTDETLPGVVGAEQEQTEILLLSGSDTSGNPGQLAGLTILGSLLGASLLLTAANSLRTRFQRGGKN